MNFFSKKKQPELKQLKDKPEKGDVLAILIAAFITLVLPVLLILIAIFGLLFLLVR